VEESIHHRQYIKTLYYSAAVMVVFIACALTMVRSYGDTLLRPKTDKMFSINCPNQYGPCTAVY
jgi:hypothetical protein